jgi:hypothetical protein
VSRAPFQCAERVYVRVVIWRNMKFEMVIVFEIVFIGDDDERFDAMAMTGTPRSNRIVRVASLILLTRRGA